MRSSGSGINGVDNRNKSVACSIRDRQSRIESNDPVAPGGRQSGSGGIGDDGTISEAGGVTGDVTGNIAYHPEKPETLGIHPWCRMYSTHIPGWATSVCLTSLCHRNGHIETMPAR